MADVVEALDGALEDGMFASPAVLDECFAQARSRAAGEVEGALGESGWYDLTAEPYPQPTTDITAPVPARRPTVNAVRRVWLAKFDPASQDWYDPATRSYTSDVYDERWFPWSRPERAARDGNYWLSSYATPANRTAIMHLDIGDLIFIQRMDPGPRHKELRDPQDGAARVIAGVSLVLAVEEWDDPDTERRERRVSLLPAARFRWPVPRETARRHGRLTGNSFVRMPQNPDGTGQLGFTLSAVAGHDDVNDLLAVCGIHPEALSDPDPARVAARLRATAHGNRPLWRLRWDHVYQDSVRRRHEQAAIAACRAWAAARMYVERADAQLRPLAGYDLQFQDFQGNILEVEVKGYTPLRLNAVKLQPSQEARAKSSAAGATPPWKLFAVLGVQRQMSKTVVKDARQVVDLLASGGLKVGY